MSLHRYGQGIFRIFPYTRAADLELIGDESRFRFAYHALIHSIPWMKSQSKHLTFLPIISSIE
jgi:hypothetical protein